jgi:signal transduction histidine kinase/ActR/RegA family two-component response regulator
MANWPREVPNVGPTAEEAKWAARFVGAGSLLTLLFEIAYLILDREHLSIRLPWVLLLHVLNVALFGLALFLAANVGQWMRAHWKAVAFAFSAMMIVSSTCIALMTGEAQPLFITLVLFLAGTGPFLSWGENTQALLSLIAIASFSIAAFSLPSRDFYGYEWLGISVATAIGIFSAALGRRLRRARRRAEEEVSRSRETLVQAERIRLAGQLASGIAHDLNNTLNAMKLRMGALMQDESVSERHAARLQAIDRGIDDAARTVARVRELGGNSENTEMESAQLAEVIERAIDLARTSVEGRSSLDGASIKIESSLPVFSLPNIRGSVSEMTQVFLNLLLNASEAMQRGGTVMIEVLREPLGVLVRVSDEGSGISPEHLESIFEPFFTTKGARGTGLGLSLVRKIIEGAGGSISAANRADRGTVFTLRIPFAPRVAHDDENVVKGASGGCRFLLVDDDAENLDALRERLVLNGHEADTARSGPEAIEKLRAESCKYDIVLCDLGMPGMNGWEVARSAHTIAPRTSFYIVTGWGKQVERDIPSAVSISGVLSKPLAVEEIERICQVRSGIIPAP